MNPPRTIIFVVMWVTRVAGAAFVVGGFSFFVSAWTERSFVLVGMGVVTIAFGLFAMSIRAKTTGSLEYGLFRPTR